MTSAPPISRPVSVAVALLCLGLVGALCFTVVLRLTGPHLFPPTDDFKPLIMMLGGFYGQRVASQLLAVFLASVAQLRSAQYLVGNRKLGIELCQPAGMLNA